MTRVLLCCGAGGVGKTTLSAAIALRLAWEGRSVAALTIDPARRLADSLGLDGLGNAPSAVPLDGLTPDASLLPSRLPAPPPARQPGGSLHALMLDAASTFDGIIHRYAPNPEAAARILANRYYRFVSTRLAGSQEYMAMVRLHDLVEDGRYDVVVVDTPPTRHALDFLTAPSRVVRVMDQGVLKVLGLARTSSGLQALFHQAGPVMQTLDRLLGLETLQELADFVSAFDGMTENLKARSQRVGDLLRSPETAFLLVTTPRAAAVDEARAFREALREAGFPFRGFLVNRVAAMPEGPPPFLASPLPPPPDDVDPSTWDQVLDRVRQAHTLFTDLARADQEVVQALSARSSPEAPLWTLPVVDTDIHHLSGVLGLGLLLPPGSELVEGPRRAARN